jgi:S-adenosylmethionine decarboxylase
MSYARKNFIFPDEQKFPHRHPQEETMYVQKFFPDVHAFMLGPLTGDHWLVYVADYVDRPTSDCVDRTLDMMMFGIDESVAELFYKDEARWANSSEVTEAAGINALLPGSMVQEHCFEPCGYSANGLRDDAYWTIHITPESHCSYASFETNARMADYSALVKAVLLIFKPDRFTMTLLADEHGRSAMSKLPFDLLITLPTMDEQEMDAVLNGSGAQAAAAALASAPPLTTPAPPPPPPPPLAPTAPVPAVPTPAVAALESDSSDKPHSTTPPTTYPLPAPRPSLSGTRTRLDSTPPSTPRSFVQSNKTSTDFMGYSCIVGNYSAVRHAKSIHDIPACAAKTIASPRAQYIIKDAMNVEAGMPTTRPGNP